MSVAIFETLQTISASTNYNTWLYSNVKDYLRGDILDIGSGIGDMAAYFQGQHISSVTCSDYSQRMVSVLEGRFRGESTYKTIQLDIGRSSLQGGEFDTITCFNVLEHIADDRKALSNMRASLKDNGRIVLLIPAHQLIYGSLDRLVGHHRRYNQRSLGECVAGAGLKIDKMFYMNFFGILTWFIAGRILKQESFNPRACQSLDKIVPFLQISEKFIYPPAGQSLIAICSKV